QLVNSINLARKAGARLQPACELAGIDPRTFQRWVTQAGLEHGDRRDHAVRPAPVHKLSQEERDEIVRIANQPEYAAMPPARIVPMLADSGRYVASESTFYRVLREVGQVTHRGRAKVSAPRREPSTHVATAPNQLWCWDMTYLPAQVRGQWFYLYLILD